jgi:hypothetical protein
LGPIFCTLGRGKINRFRQFGFQVGSHLIFLAAFKNFHFWCHNFSDDCDELKIDIEHEKTVFFVLEKRVTFLGETL